MADGFFIVFLWTNNEVVLPFSNKAINLETNQNLLSTHISWFDKCPHLFKVKRFKLFSTTFLFFFFFFLMHHFLNQNYSEIWTFFQYLDYTILKRGINTFAPTLYNGICVFVRVTIRNDYIRLQTFLFWVTPCNVGANICTATLL